MLKMPLYIPFSGAILIIRQQLVATPVHIRLRNNRLITRKMHIVNKFHFSLIQKDPIFPADGHQTDCANAQLVFLYSDCKKIEVGISTQQRYAFGISQPNFRIFRLYVETSFRVTYKFLRKANPQKKIKHQVLMRVKIRRIRHRRIIIISRCIRKIAAPRFFVERNITMIDQGIALRIAQTRLKEKPIQQTLRILKLTINLFIKFDIISTQKQGIQRVNKRTNWVRPIKLLRSATSFGKQTRITYIIKFETKTPISSKLFIRKTIFQLAVYVHEARPILIKAL